MTRVVRFLTPTGAIRAWWASVLFIVVLMAAVGLSIAYTANSVRRSDRQWCDLLTIVDTPVPTPTGSPGPLAEREIRITKAIHDLRLGKGCP